MKNFASVFVVLFAFLFAGRALAAAPQTISPGEAWLDDRGIEIQGHGGSMVLWQGTYYWFGEDHFPSQGSEKRNVACYSSKDLAHWKFERNALSLDDPEHMGPGWILERPKVFANAKTGKFVLYFHLDDAPYKAARVGVAISDRIDGEYKFVKSFRPLQQESRDIGQFVDDDGVAYLIFESRPTGGFFIARLADDYLSVQKQVSFIPAPLEGGVLVHLGGLYYVAGSHLTGWDANPDVYATAPSLSGPWTAFKDIAPPQANTYGSQTAMLVKIAGTKKTTVIYMGDMWREKQLWDSRYLWMPLEVEGGGLRLPAPRKWTLDVKTGETALLP